MEQGWVKFYRSWLDNPFISKDGEHMAIWMYLMLNATHTEIQAQFGKEIITLKAGQLLTSYREIEGALKINRRKVERVFDWFKKGTLIGTVTDMRKTLVTIEVWGHSQNETGTVKGTVEGQCGDTKQDRENEKEKRSKREKEKEKEINKNEKREEVCVYKNKGDTHGDLLPLGKYENVFVSSAWLSEFKSKYWYYDKVIDKLSIYKRAKGISNIDDMPYLELFAFEDKDKYIRREETFDADDFFEAALARSYADDDE